MTPVIYFLFGVGFILFLLPIIESVSDLICTAVGTLKAYLCIRIAKCNAIIQDIGDESTKTCTNVIGFDSTNIVEYLEEDEDDMDCATKNKKKRLFGRGSRA